MNTEDMSKPRSQEKFVVECEFDKRNPFECEREFYHTLTYTALCIIKMKESNTEEV